MWINDVAPRDGLQNEPVFVATEHKIGLIDALSRAGLAKIEATSFVSPKAIAPLADAEAVMRGIERIPAVRYTALVPNLRGAERALAAEVDELNLVMSASETHNFANLRTSREQSGAELARVMALARSAGVSVNFCLSCVFGCPMEGEVPRAVVWDWVARFVDHGASGITLCDTTGMAFPTQVADIVSTFRSRWPRVPLTLHLHNTRGMGTANVLAAVQAGADRFDASLGGIGGCPYAPGASGNVCTEDIVHMLGLIGYDTGIDLDALLACSRRLAELLNHDLPGQVVKAGHRLRLHPPPPSLAQIKAHAAKRVSGDAG